MNTDLPKGKSQPNQNTMKKIRIPEPHEMLPPVKVNIQDLLAETNEIELDLAGDRTPQLKSYTLSYKLEGGRHFLYWRCEAENLDHATEQLEDFYRCSDEDLDKSTVLMVK